MKYAHITAATLLLAAPLSHALESSAVGSAQQAAINSAMISGESKILALQTIIEDLSAQVAQLSSKVTQMETCGTQGAIWNGTECVSNSGIEPLSSGMIEWGGTANIARTGVKLLYMTSGIDYKDSDEDGTMGMVLRQTADGNYAVNIYARNDDTNTYTLRTSGNRVCNFPDSDSWGRIYQICVQVSGENFRITMGDRIANTTYFTLGTPASASGSGGGTGTTTTTTTSGTSGGTTSPWGSTPPAGWPSGMPWPPTGW